MHFQVFACRYYYLWFECWQPIQHCISHRVSRVSALGLIEWITQAKYFILKLSGGSWLSRVQGALSLRHLSLFFLYSFWPFTLICARLRLEKITETMFEDINFPKRSLVWCFTTESKGVKKWEKTKTMGNNLKLVCLCTLAHAGTSAYNAPSSLTSSSKVSSTEKRSLITHRPHLLKLFVSHLTAYSPSAGSVPYSAVCHQHLALSAWQLCRNKKQERTESEVDI